MRALNLIVNLAISLFLAPTPGLLILMYANGGSEIPPAQGLAVLLVSAVAYWLWLLNRRDARDTRQAMDAASFKAASSRPAVTAVPGMAYQPPVEEDRAARRAAALALQSHEDIVDPVAAESRRDPAEVLIDRVADLRQLKRLVADQENRLIASYSRFVDRDEYGAAIYGDWAYEVDRFLMSSSFMSRTMNRHEAIATVTAEVETSMESARSRNLEPRRRRRFGDEDPMQSGISRPSMSMGGVGAPTPDQLGAINLPQHLAKTAVRGLTEAYARILAEHGWTTQATDSPGADAIDIFAERGDVILGLRCREFASEVDGDAVREVMLARNRFGLDTAGIVSSAGSTQAARSLATSESILLIEPEDLPDLHMFVSQRRKTVVPLFRTMRRA
ncbi:MAG: restriction endonuclease [Pseudomonadota bacterium]